MSSSVRLVFFGTDNFGSICLWTLLEIGFEVLVVTKPDAAGGRGLQLKPAPIKSIAQDLNLPFLAPDNLMDIKDELKQYGASHGVLVSYGKIIPQEIIDVFPGGIINVHPSLLPKYRGPAPIQAAIVGGDHETGVSLMKLTAKMDAGPIYYQEKESIRDGQNAKELYEQLRLLSGAVLIEKLPGIILGKLKAEPQDESKASYTKLLAKDDGIIDWHESAQLIERKVRAYLIYPRSRTRLFDVDVIVTKARVAKSEHDGKLVMKANPGWLEIEELIAPSGRAVSAADFIRGYGNK